MAEKLDHFFDVYDRLVPIWFWDVFLAVGAAAFVTWVVAQLV